MNTTIRTAMARAFFASAWADMQDEKDVDNETRANLSDKEILDVMPEDIDPAAIHAARTLDYALRRANSGESLEMLFQRALSLADGDRELTPENFGHYLAMQAMGSGVGLRDAFGKAAYEAIKVPYVEFGSHSLERDY